MSFIKQFKILLASVLIILGIFIAASLLDIVLAIISSRFYSNAAFITIFGVAGIFATVIVYSYGMEQSTPKTEVDRWRLLVIIILTGLLFFFVLAKLEGGEYEIAFKAFGATTALSSLFFVKGKLE